MPSSETIPRPSALFCLSNAFRSRTLPHKERGVRRSDTQKEIHNVRHTPAGLHQGLDAEEESHVLFILQIIQHFLHRGERAGNSPITLVTTLSRGGGATLTCCTSLLPPFRMEIPSLSVEETIAPGSPGHKNSAV